MLFPIFFVTSGANTQSRNASTTICTANIIFPISQRNKNSQTNFTAVRSTAPWPQHYTWATGCYLDHCLDMLRQSVMCQGDTQLLTMKWSHENSIPIANFTMPHKCVNWENLELWARGRRIEHLMEPDYLVHPTLGAAYPGGHGDIIGEFIDTKGQAT